MANTPNATDISVGEVLEKLDSEFAPMAAALANGEFALWVGSGISRRAPNLGDLISRALEHLRLGVLDPARRADFEPALIQALRLARVQPDDARPYFAQEFDTWPLAETIKNELWNSYSRLLDIRIRGQAADYMLWEAVDIREAFRDPAAPAAQHLCIAILVMESAVREIASGNWDGFIEAAIAKLSSGNSVALEAAVDPEQLRAAAGQATLLKFHGCILYGTQDPARFRRYLTGSHTQITEWPINPDFASMRAAVTVLATNLKSLVLGLSIQDANLQGIFAAAKQVHPWPWPCAPNAPGHIFCEDEIKDGQRDVLKVVYGDAYNGNMDAIESGAHMRAWAEQVLIALVLKLLTDKLSTLIDVKLTETALADATPDAMAELLRLRNSVAAVAISDRTAFVEQAIRVWSRLLSLYRSGKLPADEDAYEVLTASRPAQIAADQNARTAGLGELAVALSLVRSGETSGLWKLATPPDKDLISGAMSAKAGWPGATERPVFLVRGAGEAIALEKAGAFANNNAIVIHADSVWQQLRGGGTTSARRPRLAPGRTNRLETRHVSIENLLEQSADFGDLRTRFVTEVTL